MPINLLADDTGSQATAQAPINLLADEASKKPASLRDMAMGALQNTLDPSKIYPFNMLKQAGTAGAIIGQDVAKMIPAAGNEIKEGAAPALEQLKTDPKRFATNVLGGAAEAGRGLVNMPHDLPTYLAHLKLVDPKLAEQISSVIPQVPELESTINQMIGQDPNAADRFIRDVVKVMPVGTQAAGAAMKVAPVVLKEGANIARSGAQMAENVAQAPMKLLGSKANPILAANEAEKEAILGQKGQELTEAEKAHSAQQEIYNQAVSEAKQKVNMADADKMENKLNTQNKDIDNLQQKSQELNQQLAEFPDIGKAEEHHQNIEASLNKSEEDIGKFLNKGAAYKKRSAAAIVPRIADIEKYWGDSFKQLEGKIQNNTFHMPEDKVLSGAERDAEIIRRIKAGANPKTVERQMEAESAGMQNPYYKELMKKAPTSTDTDLESFFTKHREFRDTLGGLKKDLNSENIHSLEKAKIREAVELAAEKEAQIKEALTVGLGEHKPEYDWLMKGYSEQVYPLRKNPVVKQAKKGRLSKSIMEDLNSNESGMPLLRDIVKQDPELVRNIIGQKFKSNPKEIFNPDELTLEYLQEHPQLLKMIENRNKLSELKENAKNNLAEVKATDPARMAVQKKIEKYESKIKELKEKIPELEAQYSKVKNEFDKQQITLKRKNELGMEMKHLRRELVEIRRQMETQTSGLRTAFMIGKTMYRAAKKVTRGF